MFCDSKPPKDKLKNEFPSLSSVVNVPNCWYYLSLLERFVNITSSLSQEDLKIYLVRAEYRYFKWMYKNTPNRLSEMSVPPIDIAFFWQAHLLSPVRYQEDIMRMTPFNTTRIPLREIHEAQGNLKRSVTHEWFSVMKDEPFDLTREALLKKGSCASITCIVCNSRIRSPWKEYAEWRTDHTIALQCCCCYTLFTVKHVGKSNLNQDNAARSNSISGLMISDAGKPHKPSYIRKSFRPSKDIMSLPFDEGLEPLDEYLEEKAKSTGSNLTPMTRKKIVNAIRSTYLCTPYRGSSIDLIQAVARQYKFAVKVTKEIDWHAPLGIIRGIRQYAKFLVVIKENKNLTAVPTYEIDLAWHTHMLHHKNYHKMCLELIGKMINHDDTIPEDDLAHYVEKTNKAWETRNKKLKAARKPPPLPIHGLTPIEEEQKKENKEVKKAGFRNKIKSFVSKASGSETKPRNRPIPKKRVSDESLIFKGKYVKGNYECPPQYTQHVGTFVVEINDNSSYEPEKVSFHDKGEIREFIELNNSNETMDATFSDAKKSIYGFIGTSTCGNTEILNQWTTEPNESNLLNYVSSNESGYTKVFKTRGNKTVFFIKRKKYERYRRSYISANYIGKDKKNSQFEWSEIISAWIKAAEQIGEISDSLAGCGGWGNCQESGGGSYNQASETPAGCGAGGGNSGCGDGGSAGASSAGGGGGSSGCGEGGGFSVCGGGGGGSSGCGGGGGGCC